MWTSPGDDQSHIVKHAFKVLANEGFLRDKGILSLESVQKFYTIIDQEPDATMRVANLLDLCDQPGFNYLEFLPIITLIKKSSETGETQGHAVVLDSYDRYDDCLVLTRRQKLTKL